MRARRARSSAVLNVATPAPNEVCSSRTTWRWASVANASGGDLQCDEVVGILQPPAAVLVYRVYPAGADQGQ
jgi:hypothetical protein